VYRGVRYLAYLDVEADTPALARRGCRGRSVGR
jgi:hypothetical protein